MNKYQVISQDKNGGYSSVWQGTASTGINALAEARQLNPELDPELLAVESL